MIERELGRGWFLQSWPDDSAAPRLYSERLGVAVQLDADDDLVLERKTAAISDVIPIAAFNALVEATRGRAVHPQQPEGEVERWRP